MALEDVTIGQCRLICGDAFALVSAVQAHALISDPPYGINFDYTKQRNGHKVGKAWGKALYRGIPVSWDTSVTGDATAFVPEPFLAFPQIILWGANHYASRLPDSGGWLIWDKRVGMTSNDMSDCELAWTNLRGATRLYRQLWNGLLRQGEENGKEKCHPAQKPIALMRWCVEQTTGPVFDPFMGSGTTGVACVESQRPFIGIEIEPRYFDVACQRIEQASQQMRLFPAAPRREEPQQAPLFAAVGGA
jgi:site-specific DNA-methyltransferase (adenine-specific)